MLAAVETLSAPMDAPSAEQWMEASALRVGRAVQAGNHIVSAPLKSRLRIVGSSHPSQEMAVYLGFADLFDRTGAVDRVTRYGAARRREAFGPHFDALRGSDYLAFSHTVGGYDSLSLSVPWRVLDRPYRTGDVVLLTFNPDERRQPFTDEQQAVARLLYPSFRAGVRTYRQLGEARANLGALLDGIGAAVALFAADGHLLHRTPALEALLNLEPLRADVFRSHWRCGACVCQAEGHSTRS